jgi:hypothetical protein
MSNCRDGEGEAGKAHGPPPFSTNWWAIWGKAGCRRLVRNWQRRRINDEARQARRLLVHAATAAAHSPSSWPMDGRRRRLEACPTLAMPSLDPHPLAVPQTHGDPPTSLCALLLHPTRRLALWLRRPACFHILAPHALDDTERW